MLNDHGLWDSESVNLHLFYPWETMVYSRNPRRFLGHTVEFDNKI